ncbi:hypothetical protein HMPREF1153_1939 [Selenomonas sp. CM52]|nr:hypothetical protein HMPREF1153_1939 [Selenomonas sp. CM52]
MNPQQKTSFFPSNFSVNHHSVPYSPHCKLHAQTSTSWTLCAALTET